MYRSVVSLQDAVVAVTVVECSMQVLYPVVCRRFRIDIGGNSDRLHAYCHPA